MSKLTISEVELLVGELWKYWEALWPLEKVIKDIFYVLNLSNQKNKINIDHNVWVQNLIDTQRFPWIEKKVSDNIFTHQVRLFQMIKELDFFILQVNLNRLKLNLPREINIEYALNLSLLHDDSEWINPLKDIPTDIKMSLSDEANTILHEIEKACIEVLTIYQKDHLSVRTKEDIKAKYDDAESKTTIEWQLVSYLDKIDWFMFCVHELHLWNRNFIEPFKNYLNILKWIKNDKSKFEKIRFLFESDIELLRELVISKFPYDKMFSKFEEDNKKYIAYTEMIRRLDAIYFFNLDFLLSLEYTFESILKSFEEKWIDTRIEEYVELIENDEEHFFFKRAVPNTKTTIYPFYESWKIAFAKVWYSDTRWKNIFWFNLMYPN